MNLRPTIIAGIFVVLAAVITGIFGLWQGVFTSNSTPVPPQSTAVVQSTPSTPIITAQRNMDIREGPATVFNRIAVLSIGEHLDILGISEDNLWYQVLLPDGHTGWVVASSSSGIVSGSIGALSVIVPTATLTHTLTNTPTATNTTAPTGTLTQTISPTNTSTPSITPQLPTHTQTVQLVVTQTHEVIATPSESESSSVTGGHCPSQFGIDMVSIPMTTFLMGSEIGQSDERPVREVTVDGFCIDVFEVTNTQYTRCVNDGICTPHGA